MTDLEAKTLKEIEMLKAKTAIAVAILSNCEASTLSALSTNDRKSGMFDTIRKAQATIEK
ncbi:MAG: hypothetical protein GAK29_03617 [Acinetobacter bereziniae]|uniref:Uncharacterized protein n=1 Tax=Acinetobacter bereziniae TaxID=106648 RepID=A0A833UKX7_ACIBZ|nr:MAG: hypothetical protein GAK29_03617 [Acinetobacter bereziniae]